MFTGDPHAGDRGAGAALDHHQVLARLPHLLQPGVQAPLLVHGAALVPAPVAEHQDVGPGQPLTARTGRQRRRRPEGDWIDGDEGWRRREQLAAPAQALEVLDGAVALDDALAVEAGPLELAID